MSAQVDRPGAPGTEAVTTEPKEPQRSKPKASDPPPVREAVAWRENLQAGQAVLVRMTVTDAKPRNDYRGLYYIECKDPWDSSEPPIPVSLCSLAYPSPDPLPVSREAVARIIEPSAFETHRWKGAFKRMIAFQNDALAKADAILALTGETSRG